MWARAARRQLDGGKAGSTRPGAGGDGEGWKRQRGTVSEATDSLAWPGAAHRLRLLPCPALSASEGTVEQLPLPSSAVSLLFEERPRHLTQVNG